MKVRLLLPMVCVLALGLSACGSKSTLTSNKQVTQAATAGETIVAKCAEKNHHLLALKKCIIPPGSGPKLETCMAQALAKYHGVTKSQRQEIESAWAVCAEQYR